jgi:hypothetical protein
MSSNHRNNIKKIRISKYEIRNNLEMRIFKILNKNLMIRSFLVLVIEILVICICFEFRYSNFGFSRHPQMGEMYKS